MFSASIYFHALALLVIAAVCTWVLSLARRNVALIDSLWSLMFVLAACTYALGAGAVGYRAALVLSLVTVWALRLSIYITYRNQSHFGLKSLYLIFVLQAVLAWIISLPLLGAILNPGPIGMIDFLGAALWGVEFTFEAGADWQLSILGPALMSLLLIRVSGVSLLEKDIGARRPKYAEYIRRTTAFFPWKQKGR
jgi:steroid 5-alpha reductase family enzyme